MDSTQLELLALVVGLLVGAGAVGLAEISTRRVCTSSRDWWKTSRMEHLLFVRGG